MEGQMRGVKVREKDANWYVFANHLGQRRAKMCGAGKPGKALADRLAKEWGAALTLGQAERVFAPQPVQAPAIKGKSKCPTVAQAFPLWLDARIKGADLREASGLAYTSAMRTWVLPKIGDVPVDQVTREQVGAVITAAKTAGKSRSIVGHILKATRGLFSTLADEKTIPADPTIDLRRFVGRGGKRKAKAVGDKDIFARDECKTLLKAAQSVAPRLYPLIALALGTGLRSGELLALTKDDIELRPRHGIAGRVLVNKSWSRNTRRLTATKNEETRQVALSAELVDILKAWFEVRKAEGWGDEQIVFPSEEDHNRHVLTWHVRWRTLLKRAKVRYRKFHATRHSFASHALRAGARPELVQRWLGHATLSLTLDVYRHFVVDHEADAKDAAKLGSLVEC
jgi:integrase